MREAKAAVKEAGVNLEKAGDDDAQFLEAPRITFVGREWRGWGRLRRPESEGRGLRGRDGSVEKSGKRGGQGEACAG